MQAVALLLLLGPPLSDRSHLRGQTKYVPQHLQYIFVLCNLLSLVILISI